MKITTLMGAGLLAAGTLAAAAPAEAHPRFGYGYGYDGGYRDYDRGWRGDRWERGPRWGRGYGYGRPYGYGYRSRVVCRLRPGYYGPVRTCVRIFR